MATTIPFPPAPEPGWYEDDALPDVRPAHELAEDIASIADTPFDAEALDGAGDGIPATMAAALADIDDASGDGASGTSDAPGRSRASSPMHTIPMMAHAATAAQGSPAAGPTHPSGGASGTSRTYLLRNNSTHQSIVIDATVLLGRLPSEGTPNGAKPVQVEDPTRTISRNHAMIVVDGDGRLWLGDCDSLNGTYLVVDGHDRKIAPGEDVALAVPSVIRLGDQLFELTESPAGN